MTDYVYADDEPLILDARGEISKLHGSRRLWKRFFECLGFKTEEALVDDVPVLKLLGDKPLVVMFTMSQSEKQFEADSEHASKFLKANGFTGEALLVGPELYMEHEENADYAWSPIGMMSEEFTDGHLEGHTEGNSFSPARLFGCTHCNRYAIQSIYQSWEGKPCGHHDGAHFVGSLDYDDAIWAINRVWSAVLEELGSVGPIWPLSYPPDKDYDPYCHLRDDHVVWNPTTPRYALYRSYSDMGDLLYIGQSNHWGRRMREHELTSPWFAATRRITIQMYQSRSELDRAEKLAIETEHPLYNVVHKRARGRRRK